MQPTNEETPFEIECHGVKTLLDSQEEVCLLDVRTPAEHEIVNLPQTTLIPMQEIVERVHELEEHRQKRVVVFCHHGGRSERVAVWLRQQGFSQAQNMTGGIDAWAVQIDPNLTRY